MSDGTTTPGDCPIETATEGGWFGITTAEDFFRKVCTDYERALKDIADPYAAMKLHPFALSSSRVGLVVLVERAG